MAEAITFITGLIEAFFDNKGADQEIRNDSRVCEYAVQHANSKVPMFVQRVDPLGPLFEHFFIFSGLRGTV
jgi:hypothetical protein